MAHGYSSGGNAGDYRGEDNLAGNEIPPEETPKGYIKDSDGRLVSIK